MSVLLVSVISLCPVAEAMATVFEALSLFATGIVYELLVQAVSEVDP